MLTRRDLLADSSAVLIMAWGEFGCRTELFVPVSHLTHSDISTSHAPSCYFRRDIAEGGGCGSRRIPNTLERLLEEPSGINTRPSVVDRAVSEGIRAIRYVAGMLVQRDENLDRGLLVSDPLYSSRSDPFALSALRCRERPNLHTIARGTFRR